MGTDFRSGRSIAVRLGLWLAAWAFSPSAAPCQELTALGKHLVEVYDREALAEYVFRSPWNVPMAVLVFACAWTLAGRLRPGETDRFLSLFVRHERAVVASLALGTGVFALWVSVRVLGGVPHIQDSRAYLFQARLLAAGRLTAPAPPPPLDRALAIDFTVMQEDRWYGRFPFGWPAVLSLGVLAGHPYAVNPVLTGLAVVVLHLFLRRLTGPPWALAATALVATSPFFTLMGGSYLSHPLGLLLVLGALQGYRLATQGDRNGPLLWALASGLLCLTRPSEGVFWVVVPAVHLLARGLRRSPRDLGWVRGLPILALFFCVGLGYNRATTGHLFTPPTLQFDPTDHPGFSETIGVYGREGHNLGRGIHNLVFQWAATNDVLFGWPYLSLLPAALGLLRGRSGDPFESGWLVMTLLYEAFLTTWHSPGFGFGPRYQFCLLPLLAYFTARGLAFVSRLGHERARGAILVFAVYLAALSVMGHYPRRLETLRFYYRVFPAQTVLAGVEPKTSVIVVPELWIDGLQEAFASFESITTPFPGGGGPVAARDLPGVVPALRKAFPDRPHVFRLPPDSLARAISIWVGRPVTLTRAPTIPEDLATATPRR